MDKQGNLALIEDMVVTLEQLSTSIKEAINSGLCEDIRLSFNPETWQPSYNVYLKSGMGLEDLVLGDHFKLFYTSGKGTYLYKYQLGNISLILKLDEEQYKKAYDASVKKVLFSKDKQLDD